MSAPPIPSDISALLVDLMNNYDELFMVVFTSPCAECHGGKPRLVHRSPKMAELGTRLKNAVANNPSLQA